MKDKEKQIFDKYGNYDFPTNIKQECPNNATSQIEEIKQIINERCEAELEQVHASSMGGKVIKTVDTKLIAKDIYEYLTKDSVVLSMEEYNDLKARANKKIDGLELKIGGASGWFPIEFIKGAIERDLDHDRIVLSREEYDKLKQYEYKVRSGVCFTQKEWFDYANEDSKERTTLRIEAKEQGSKETAEKIFKELKTRLKDCPEVIEEGYNVQNSVDYFEDIIGYDKFCADEIIKELAKQFGVELKEGEQ